MAPPWQVFARGGCDDATPPAEKRNSDYWGERRYSEGGKKRCPIFSCKKTKIYDSAQKKCFEEVEDWQMTRIDKDLITGQRTGRVWKPGLCFEAADSEQELCKGCNKANNPFGSDLIEETVKEGDTIACEWPAKLWYGKDPWKKEEEIVSKLENKGADSAHDAIMQKKAEFWLALQQYLDDWKETEEKNRDEWDLHVAYFVQVISPMVEEALYINEVLNQMKGFLKAVSAWGLGDAKKEPWLADHPKANLEAPSTKEVQQIDVLSDAYLEAGYEPSWFVQEKNAASSYYGELMKSGRDRVLGTSMLELIRREAAAKGMSKYRVLFGAFVRSDRPNGDATCSGVKQTLDFAQTLIDGLGFSRDEYVQALTAGQGG